MKGKHKIVVKNNRLHYEFEIKKKYHDNKRGQCYRENNTHKYDQTICKSR